MASHYDLAIAGGSFAGLVCARSAALRSLRTLVLERQPAPGARVRTTGILVKEVAERWEVPSRLIGRRAGVIPVGGRVTRWFGDRLLLVGDAAGIVSPLTAGGIHTALESGWRAAHAIADHLADGAPHPAQMLGDAYPRFLWKGALRRLLDAAPPDWLADALIATPPLRAAAQAVYFHHRGLMSARAWSDLWQAETRRRVKGG